VDGTLELCDVVGVSVQVEHVAARSGLDQLVAEEPAQRSDVGVDRALGGGRRVAGPEAVDQAIDGDRTVRFEEEHREHAAMRRPLDRDRDVGDDLERSECGEAHSALPFVAAPSVRSVPVEHPLRTQG